MTTISAACTWRPTPPSARDTKEVRELAARIAKYQEIEANEYTQALKRLGLESS